MRSTYLALIFTFSIVVCSAIYAAKPVDNANQGDQKPAQPAEQLAPGQALLQYTTNITENALAGAYNHYMPRPEEESTLSTSLYRQMRGNVILTGERGAGKTAIVERVSATHQVYMLRMSDVIDGKATQGQFEQRIKAVITDLKALKGKAVLFIDEAHLIFLNPIYQSAAQDLKNGLSRGEFRLWLATTGDEAKLMDKDPAFKDRFVFQNVPTPTRDQLLSFARLLKPILQAKHKLYFLESALEKAVDLALRFMTDQSASRATEDLLDSTGARINMEAEMGTQELRIKNAEIVVLEAERASIQSDLNILPLDFVDRPNLQIRLGDLNSEIEQKESLVKRKNAEIEKNEALKNGNVGEAARLQYEVINVQKQSAPVVTEKKQPGVVEAVDIATSLHEQARYSMATLMDSSDSLLANFSRSASTFLPGQESMLQQIQDGLDIHRSGLKKSANVPFSALVVGGTDELAALLAEEGLGDRSRLVEINLSQYGDKHSISRFIGAPPGYAGHGESGILVDAVKGRGEVVVHFQNFDKAHAEIQAYVRDLIKKGAVQDNSNRKADFRHAYVIASVSENSNTLEPNIEKYFNVSTKMTQLTLAQTVVGVQKKLEDLKKLAATRKKIKVSFDDALSTVIAQACLDSQSVPEYVTNVIDHTALGLLVKLINKGQVMPGQNVEILVQKSNSQKAIIVAKVNGVLIRDTFLKWSGERPRAVVGTNGKTWEEAALAALDKKQSESDVAVRNTQDEVQNKAEDERAGKISPKTAAKKIREK